MACFTTKELINLMLWPKEQVLLNTMLDARLQGTNIDDMKLKQSVLKLAKNSVKSTDYEYWVSIFTLSEEFGKDCEVCFYLKDTFDHHKQSITTYTDLEKFKEQNTPADVILKQGSNRFFEFQLKRYQGDLNQDSLFTFIKKKIMHYSSPINYCIILQHSPGTKLPTFLFEDLCAKIKTMPLQKRDLGRICFLFNANNKYMILAHVYPELAMYKRPFIKGSEQAKEIISPKMSYKD